MRPLYALWLVDGILYMVIFPLKVGLFFCPHFQNDLYCFAQLPKTGRAIGKVIPISAKLLLVPTCADAEIESSVTESIYSTRHLCKQSRVAVAVTRNHLANPHLLCITC